MIRIAVMSGVMAALFPAIAVAAALRDARVAIVFSPGACDVTSRFVIDTPEPAIIEHRLLLNDRSAPEFAVIGAVAGRADIIGRTVRLPISLTGSGRNEYGVRYRVALPRGSSDRCPLLVPSSPTDGVTRAVRIDVDVPHDAIRRPGQFPAFTWDGPPRAESGGHRGTVTIGHMPSFVRTPYAPRHVAISWRDTLDIRRIVDLAAVVAIVTSTLAWVALRRREA